MSNGLGMNTEFSPEYKPGDQTETRSTLGGTLESLQDGAPRKKSMDRTESRSASKGAASGLPDEVESDYGKAKPRRIIIRAKLIE